MHRLLAIDNETNDAVIDASTFCVRLFFMRCFNNNNLSYAVSRIYIHMHNIYTYYTYSARFYFVLSLTKRSSVLCL